MIAPLVVPPMLVANGIGAGILLWSSIAGTPLMMVAPPQRYVQMQQFWGRRFEPLQPICIAVTGLAAVALAVAVTGGPARWLFVAAATAAAAAITVSVTRNVPIKRWVMSLDAKALPADFAQRDPRQAWAAWNLTRTVLAVVALAANCVAIGFLLWK